MKRDEDENACKSKFLISKRWCKVNSKPSTLKSTSVSVDMIKSIKSMSFLNLIKKT